MYKIFSCFSNLLVKLYIFIYTFIFCIKNKEKSYPFFEDENLGIIYRTASRKDIKYMNELYYALNGRYFSFFEELTLFFFISRTVFLAELISEGSPKIIGLNYYYFNLRDIQENSIHEGFIGVLPNFEGKGIATKMRLISIDFFKEMKLKAISSRISMVNIASLISAKKVGFEKYEKYRDELSNEIRFYMLNKL